MIRFYYWISIKGEEKVILNILGGGGSGKTSLKRALLKRENFSSFVSYTTRKKRKDEYDGVDYHFLTHHEFEGKALILQRVFNGQYYGVCREDLLRGFSEVILVTTFDANGIRSLEDLQFDVKVVFLDIPVPVRRVRMSLRGDSEEEINLKLRFESTHLVDMNFRSPILRITSGSLEQILSSVCDFVQMK